MKPLLFGLGGDEGVGRELEGFEEGLSQMPWLQDGKSYLGRSA